MVDTIRPEELDRVAHALRSARLPRTVRLRPAAPAFRKASAKRRPVRPAAASLPSIESATTRGIRQPSGFALAGAAPYWRGQGLQALVRVAHAAVSRRSPAATTSVRALAAPFIGRTFDPATAFYRRSIVCRSKTAWPSRSRMRKATVLGGNARFAAATIAADTSDA
jgi:hypothetical protein